MKYKALFITLAALALTSCSSNKLKDQTPDEKKAEVYYGQGTTELVNKDYQASLNHLLKAKELNSKDSKIRNNLGMAYYFRNQTALAEEELKKAIDLDEKNSDARLNLGSLYMDNKKIKEARAQFEKVSEDLTYQAQFRNLYNLALLSLNEGDRRMAFDYLAKSIQENNDYCPAHYKLGEMYAEEYRFQQALDAFKESGKGTCVSDPAPLYQIAITLVNLNRPTEAKMMFQEIMEKFPSTRYGTLAAVQIKKISNSNEEQSIRTRTELMKQSDPVETPNF
ncbi:MAG: tetratricopeptide repeat protein [Bacteriovorax sp.]|nr:tetratricopeptide repeat protein [Bacteriovorax sp.]